MNTFHTIEERARLRTIGTRYAALEALYPDLSEASLLNRLHAEGTPATPDDLIAARTVLESEYGPLTLDHALDPGTGVPSAYTAQQSAAFLGVSEPVFRQWARKTPDGQPPIVRTNVGTNQKALYSLESLQTLYNYRKAQTE